MAKMAMTLLFAIELVHLLIVNDVCLINIIRDLQAVSALSADMYGHEITKYTPPKSKLPNERKHNAH
jgi:hypothetical protein